jgi:hypothetical protein
MVVVLKAGTPEQGTEIQGRSIMKIVGFVWLEEIVEKLEAKHRVVPGEGYAR